MLMQNIIKYLYILFYFMRDTFIVLRYCEDDKNGFLRYFRLVIGWATFNVTMITPLNRFVYTCNLYTYSYYMHSAYVRNRDQTVEVIGLSIYEIQSLDWGSTDSIRQLSIKSSVPTQFFR